MGIPESQLQTWSNPGPQTSAKQTHESVRAALQFSSSPLIKRFSTTDLEIYLQGSYKNDTNIRGDSDVDLVVQLNAVWNQDLSSLLQTEQAAYKQAYSDSTYDWFNLKADTLAALKSYYGSAKVREGKKCINVETPYLACDVLVALQFRKYRRFFSVENQDFIEGIKFYIASESRWVINYPKQHYDNGVTKNTSTSQWFKPTVRMVKNARNYLAERKRISDDLAPSYFVQCLLYNVPNYCYGKSFGDTYCNVVNWLHKTDINTFRCENEQVLLFGNTPEQWDVNKARAFVSALIALWNNWQ